MYTISLTSKNQITIPAKLVRELGFDKTRRLRVEKRGKAVTLTAEPVVEAQFDQLWSDMAPKIKPLPAADLGRAKAGAWSSAVRRKAKKLPAS